ncbi:MAG: hypothetical protein ACI4XC_09305 [Eubacterium sp.]
MRVCVINTQNGLLSGAIAKCLNERGEIQPQRVLKPADDEIFSTCCCVKPDILLMEVNRFPNYTFDERIKIAEKVKKHLPKCKIAFLCDENSDTELAYRVKETKKEGRIDAFFYASVTAEYLTDALDAI